ncbi:MAG: tyrosine recombinase [Bacteroidota bacterium]
MSRGLSTGLMQRQDRLWVARGPVWAMRLRGYRAWLGLEKSLAPLTLEAYLRDVHQMAAWLQSIYGSEVADPSQVTKTMLREWLAGLTELGLQAVSQARMLSAVKSFYDYLEQEGGTTQQPAALLELPRLSRKLPTVLGVEEVQAMIDRVDLSQASGHRDRCMLELMYACGLRVSEVVGLQWSDLLLDLGLVRVRGKGNRERLVPLGSQAINSLKIYRQGGGMGESHNNQAGEGKVFLSRNGRPLTRMVVFLLVKKQAALCGITKVVGPHAFRHAFATHMVEAGADLRAVQEMLGHRSILTTEIYTHLSRDYLREVVQRFHPLSGAGRSHSRADG